MEKLISWRRTTCLPCRSTQLANDAPHCLKLDRHIEIIIRI